MMNYYLLLLCVIVTVLSEVRCLSIKQPNENEVQVLAECLESYGGLTPENAERLQRYKQWSDTYEEVPCFTNCYLSKLYDFYDENTGFQEDGVIKEFGRPLYNACRHRMSQGGDKCEIAYNGFHCIASLENDPFVVIESMQNLNSEAKTAMKDCLHKFDRYEWERLTDYSTFPVREPIPCFTKCFMDKLQLFNERTRQWNMESMHRKLGVPADGVKANHCRRMTRRRTRNACSWMYQEFTCFVLAKE